MEAAAALDALWAHLKTSPAPAFDWVVEHAPDGDIDGAIQRLWVRCKDPHTLEAMSRRLPREDLTTGWIALGRYLAKRIGRQAVNGYDYVEAVATERASSRGLTWDEYADHEDDYTAEADRAVAKFPAVGADADDYVKEMWSRFRTYCRLLMRRVFLTSWGARPWEVDQAVQTLEMRSCIGVRLPDRAVLALAAEHDVARVLRNAWPAPTLAQLTEKR